ncbi:uncharacterized protein LOC110465644 [Mizuhopecten yessoensis]|uniref:uncharacterized protein LOC110465644 n=1 Tax=Mizuhopecten yessoensis TaxID=6573 RepID=UPI000B45C390|nr:uncharacterized protein LOC110465644 [Mizuhopecten yessoensis]
MVCVPCKTAVCELCIEDSHDGHSLQTFKTTATNVISDLLKLTEKESFTKLEKHLQDISTIRETEGEQAVKTKQELLDRRDQLKQALDEVTVTAVATLDQHNENLFKELDEAKEKAMEQSQKVSDFKSEVERLKSSQNHLEVVKEGWKIESPEIAPLEFPKVSRLVFQFDTPGNVTNIEMLFGNLVPEDLYALTTFHPDGTFSTPVLGHYNPNPSPTSSICSLDLFGEGPEEANSTQTQPTGQAVVPTPHKSSQNALKCDVKLTRTRSFKLPSAAWLMQPTVGGNCWITCGGKENTVTLVSATGDVIQDVPCTTTINGILVLPVTNQVLLACPEQKCIKQVIMKQDEYTVANSKWINTDPLVPHCMCVTSNGDILVTMTDKTSWSAEPTSTSILVKYNSKGQKLARAHKDGHGQDLFFLPYIVNTSNTGTVAVVNITKSKPTASHLVLLDHEFNLTHRYVYHELTVPAEDKLPEIPEKFCISDVLFNHHSLLLVSELHSRTVQLLDTMCNLLKVLVTDPQGLPRSLALHADGELWVGLYDRIVQVYKHTCDFISEEK